MSERKFNRDQNDTEPVKFKPLYLIVGICVVVITVLACAIYVYLEGKDSSPSVNENKGTNVNETIKEPARYVIPQTACVKNVTATTYNDQVYSSCPAGNMVLNFTDLNMIIDINKDEINFTINGIYYNMVNVELDDYLKSGIFKGLAFAQNNQDLQMVVDDASVDKKSGLYIFNTGKVVYSMGSDSNTVFAFGTPIKYAKYAVVTEIDCTTADPNAIVYEFGSVMFDGTNYQKQFVQNVLVSEYCK